MKRLLLRRRQRVLAVITFAMLVVTIAAGAMMRPAAARAADVPAFLRSGQCYRLTFSVEGAPAWKVLEVLDAGWIRAEVDTGPACRTLTCVTAAAGGRVGRTRRPARGSTNGRSRFVRPAS